VNSSVATKHLRNLPIIRSCKIHRETEKWTFPAILKNKLPAAIASFFVANYFVVFFQKYLTWFDWDFFVK
jgi:hypothetical protein